MKRSAFDNLGGFAADHLGAGYIEEFVNLASMTGMAVEPLPAAVVHFDGSKDPASAGPGEDSFDVPLRTLRPYLNSLPPMLQPMLIEARSTAARKGSVASLTARVEKLKREKSAADAEAKAIAARLTKKNDSLRSKLAAVSRARQELEEMTPRDHLERFSAGALRKAPLLARPLVRLHSVAIRAGIAILRSGRIRPRR